MSQREFHPVANIFPLMVESEIASLAADIKIHGLREPIWTDAEGKIIDGRNRFVACQRAKVEPTFRAWDGEGSLVEFVVSLNLKRRHLNESQRAMVAAEIAKLEHGANQHRKEEGEICPSSPTLEQAASMLNVSRASVVSAKKVLSEGTAEEIDAVKRGDAAASTIAKQIRRSMPTEKRQERRNAPLASRGSNPERIQNMQIEAQLWEKLSGAIDNLTALPRPADVVAIVRKNASRTRQVDARISTAIRWLEEFSNEWNRRAVA